MIAFVDEYWKIIHRAAGWDALRYWLLVSFSPSCDFFFPIWKEAENRSLLPFFSLSYLAVIFIFIF